MKTLPAEETSENKVVQTVDAKRVADTLSVTPQAVTLWARNGRIPVAVKLPGGAPRFVLDDVLKALANG